MSEEQLHMMKHAWAFDHRKPGYRNHYCTELDDPDMLALMKDGYFCGPTAVGLVGDGHGIFHLTDKAIRFLKDLRKQPPSARAEKEGDAG